MKKILIILFFCTFFFCCKRESAKEITAYKSIDSLIVEANKTTNYTTKLTIANKALNQLESNDLDTVTRIRYMNLSRIYLSINNLQYVKICEKLISNPSYPVNHNEVSFSNYMLGNYYYNTADYEKSFIYFSKAEKSFRILKDEYYLAYILNSKADILSFKNDYTGAEILAIKSLKIAKKLNKYDIIYGCYITLGNSLTGLKNYDKALDYYKKANEVCENLKSDTNYLYNKIQAFNYSAAVHQKQKNHNKSLFFSKKGMSLLTDKNSQIYLYCYLNNNIGYSKFKLGDKSSVNQFLETLKIGDSLKFAPIQITSKTYLGEYYLAQKDIAKANFYLKDAQKLAHKNAIFEDELTILKHLGEANPDKTTYYSNRFIQLNDSLQIVERKTRDKFARIEFETDQIILEKETVEKEKDQLSSRIWIIIGFSILILLVVLLWFMNKSQKAKTRELLLKQEQQKANEEIYQLIIDQQQKIEEGKNIEKQRISLDLHDSVMGKLTAVRLNLYVALFKNNLSDNADFSKQIDEIQEVEKEIRAIAHDLNSNLFSDNANFISVVQQLFNKIENHSQLQFNLQVSDALNWDLVSNSIKINLYRILQEALQNIEKYANAKQVTIVMTLSDANEIEIKISDDGNGFDSSKKSSGIGLKNMQFRIEEIKGLFSIQSQIGKGTKINLTIPL